MRGLEAVQTAHKTGQAPVAHGCTGLGDIDVDVAQGADLKVLRRQVVGLHVDEASGRDHRGLVEAVGEVAVAVEVDTGFGFGERVGGVTVVVEVKSFEHIAAAASHQHHLLDGRARGGAAAVVTGLDGDGAGQDQVLARHQLQAAVGRQAARQRQGAAGFQNDGVGRHGARQSPGIRVGQAAFTKLDEVAGAVFDVLERTEVPVQLHRVTGHKGNAAVVDQSLAAAWAQHRHAGAGAAQGDRVALHQAAVAGLRHTFNHHRGATHAQLLLSAQGDIATGGGGDHRAQHVQACALLAQAVLVRQGDVAAGRLRVQRVDGHFQAGDAQRSAHGEAVGDHIHGVVHEGLDHAPGGGGERHIAQRAELRRCGEAVVRTFDQRQFTHGFGVGASRHQAHKNVAHCGDVDVVGVAVGLRAHIHQIHRTGGVEREAAVGHAHLVELEVQAALVDEHIARTAGLQAQAVYLGLHRCRQAAQATEHGKAQIVGQDRLGGVCEGEHTFDQEAHVATAHTGVAAGAELAHAQVGGGGAGTALFGAHRDVVAVAQTLCGQLQRVHVADVVEGNGAVQRLGLGHRQDTQVVQRDVAHVAQGQAHRGGLGVEGDAAGGAGCHAASAQQAAGQVLRGDHGACGVAALHQGLQHAAFGSGQHDGLARCDGAQAGVGQHDVATVGARAQVNTLAAGHDLGVAVGADAAAARHALAGAQDHRAGVQTARQRQVAPSAHREGGCAVGAAAAAQTDVAGGAQVHRGAGACVFVLYRIQKA